MNRQQTPMGHASRTRALRARIYAVTTAILLLFAANSSLAEEAIDAGPKADTATEVAPKDSGLDSSADTSNSASAAVLLTTAKQPQPSPETPPPPITPEPVQIQALPASPQLTGMAQVRHQTVIDRHGNLQQAGFTLTRARVGLDGRLGQKVAYQISAAADLGHPELFTAFVDYSPWRFFSLRAGQMRVPFSRSTLTPEERLAFSERSVATAEFAYLRDIGLTARAHTWEDRLELILGAFNGAGPNHANDSRAPMLLLRLAGVPLGRAWQPAEGDPQKTRDFSLMLGGTMTVDYVPAPAAYGYASGSAVPVRAITVRDTNHDGHVDDVRVVQLAADIALRFRGLALECELYQRGENWKQISTQPGSAPLRTQGRFRGWFTQLSYFILPERLQVAGRASVARVSPLPIGGQTRPETSCLFVDGTTAQCQLPYADVRSELAALLAFQYSGLRISGTYSRFRWSSDGAIPPPPATEHRLTLQAQWVL